MMDNKDLLRAAELLHGMNEKAKDDVVAQYALRNNVCNVRFWVSNGAGIDYIFHYAFSLNGQPFEAKMLFDGLEHVDDHTLINIVVKDMVAKIIEQSMLELMEAARGRGLIEFLKSIEMFKSFTVPRPRFEDVAGGAEKTYYRGGREKY